MNDPLPAMIAAGRAASEGATEGPWVARYHPGDDNGPHSVSTAHGKSRIKDRVYVVKSCRQDDARHIAAHPPAVTRALWDAVEALATILDEIGDGGDGFDTVRLGNARSDGNAALARLRALAEAGR